MLTLERTATNGNIKQNKKMKTNFKKVMMVLSFFSIALFVACKDDDDTNNVNPDAPTVVSTLPANNATGVERNVNVSINFSETMAAATINDNTFTLKQGNNEIAGTVVVAGSTAVFTPDQSLAAGTVYAASISTEAKNSEGEALAEKVEWTFTTGGSTSSIEEVDLAASGNYVIMAKTAINNNPTSAISGDVALSPAAAMDITGFDLVDDIGYATSSQITGRVYASDMDDPTPSNLTTAVENMNTAYNDAEARTSPDFVEMHAGDLSGKTLEPGVYKWSNDVEVTTNMVISGSSTDVWIFQIGGDLTISSSTIVSLTGGAGAENIFWQVAGEVIVRSTAQMKGIIMSKTEITLETGASLQGRAFAQTAVIMDANVVTQPE